MASGLLKNEQIRTTVQRVQASAYHRLIIWNFASDRIAERPWFGWGLDSSRAIPGGRDVAQLPPDPWGQGGLLPLHPHNAALQVRLELELIGLIIVLLLIAVPLWRLPDRISNRSSLAAALGAATVMLVVAFASFGIWQSWWLCTLWISVSLCTAITCANGRIGETVGRAAP